MEICGVGKQVGNRFENFKGLLRTAGMRHGVNKGDCHDLYPELFRIEGQFKRLFIVNIRVFIVADQVVGLPYLEIEIGIVRVFFDLLPA